MFWAIPYGIAALHELKQSNFNEPRRREVREGRERREEMKIVNVCRGWGVNYLLLSKLKSLFLAARKV